MEFTLILDESSNEPLYMQLYDYIRKEIASGRIATNQKLPSIRSLSEYLRISRTPVALAYDQLLAEGYIRSQPRSGFFAVEVEHFKSSPPAKDLDRSLVEAPSVLHSYHASQNEQVDYDFAYGRIDLSSFPLTKWRKLMNHVLLPENSRLLLYGDVQGELELRAEIAAYLHQNRGVRCSPEQIVVGAGTYHSLDLLFQLIKEDVTHIAVEQAVNDGVHTLLKQFRFTCHPLRLESDGIRIEDVYDSSAQAVYVTPSHQFPFGMTLSVNKRIKLLNWARERQVFIIENDYDGEFRYNGRPIPSLQSLDEHGRVIYAGTFSKALTPAFRLSYLVLPPVLLERFRQRKISYDQLASPIFQKTLQLFMKTGDFSRHMRKMRSLYHKKHDALLQAVHEEFQHNVDIIGAGSGLHILLQVNNWMREIELVETARKAGVKVYPTSNYALEARFKEETTVLLGFGGLSEVEIRAGVHLLGQAWGHSGTT